MQMAQLGTWVLTCYSYVALRQGFFSYQLICQGMWFGETSPFVSDYYTIDANLCYGVIQCYDEAWWSLMLILVRMLASVIV